jgi:hypothetical protein
MSVDICGLSVMEWFIMYNRWEREIIGEADDCDKHRLP